LDGVASSYDGLTPLEARSMIPQECVGQRLELEQREPEERRTRMHVYN
jgi:hypothetical protein